MDHTRTVLWVISRQQQEEYQSELEQARRPGLDFVFMDDPEEALDILARGYPALVVLGMEVGTMEGLEILALLMSRYTDFASPVLVLPDRGDPFPPMLHTRDPLTEHSATDELSFEEIMGLLDRIAAEAARAVSEAKAAVVAEVVRAAEAEAAAEAARLSSSARPKPAVATPAELASAAPVTPRAVRVPTLVGLASPAESSPEVPASLSPAEPAFAAQVPSEAARVPTQLGLAAPAVPSPVVPAASSSPGPPPAEPPSAGWVTDAAGSALAETWVQPGSAAPRPGPRWAIIVVLLVALAGAGVGAFLVLGGTSPTTGQSPVAGAPEAPSAPRPARGETGEEPIGPQRKTAEREAPAADASLARVEPQEEKEQERVEKLSSPPAGTDQDRGLDLDQEHVLPISFDQGRARAKIVDPSRLEALLGAAARTLQRDPRLILQVGGHTSTEGHASFNNSLSVSRARAAVKLIRRVGIPGSRMVVRGFGEHVPLASNDTEQGRSTNRRVTMRLVRR